MANFTVYSIGRGDQADIQLDDPTVSRIHAELVVTAGDKFYITDCLSSGGTFLEEGGKFESVQQSYVERADKVKFGEFCTTLQDLLVYVNDLNRGAGSHKDGKGAGAPPTGKDDLPSGPVRRDPVSGEIISEKD